MMEILRAVNSELRKLNIKPLVCGGSALELSGFPVKTEDIDLLVTVEQFNKLNNTLKKSNKFRVIDRVENRIGTEFKFKNRGMDVEFVNAELFSGKLSAKKFFNYLEKYRSSERNGILFVEPEVVWFMRLVIGGWQVYVQKIVRDIKAGVPVKTISKIKKLAKKTRTEKLLRERIKKLKEIIKTIQ